MPTDRYTLWGWTARWPQITRPLAVTSGSLRDCEARRKQFTRDYPDALTDIRTPASGPGEGLAAQVQQRIEQEA